MRVKNQLIHSYERLYNWARQKRFDLHYRFDVMSMEQTIDYISSTGCSIARFGDGEFGLITGGKKPSFQSADEELAKRLQEVCICQDSHLLVCIPHNFKSTDDCNEFARRFWDWWIWDNNNLEKVAKCLKLSPWKKKIFGDAQVTRPYMDWDDKSKAGEHFLQLRSLWEKRDVVVAEGNQTKLGVGNDLLENALSIRRIICPAVNAFSRYSEILKAVKMCEKGALFLLALGPTATVLAYDMAKDGYQAIDIGHVDIEYEWYLRSAKTKVAIPGKYTQEVHEFIAETKEDSRYLEQIIMRIE